MNTCIKTNYNSVFCTNICWCGMINVRWKDQQFPIFRSRFENWIIVVFSRIKKFRFLAFFVENSVRPIVRRSDRGGEGVDIKK